MTPTPLQPLHSDRPAFLLLALVLPALWLWLVLWGTCGALSDGRGSHGNSHGHESRPAQRQSVGEVGGGGRGAAGGGLLHGSSVGQRGGKGENL